MNKQIQTSSTGHEKQVRALQFKYQGWKQVEIAAKLGVTPGTVCRWLQSASSPLVVARAIEALQGPQATLTPEQGEELLWLLTKDPVTYSLPGIKWTSATIHALIDQVFGVVLSPSAGEVLLQRLDWQSGGCMTQQVTTLKKQGKTPEQIAAHLGVALATVQHNLPTSQSAAPSTPRRQQLVRQEKLTLAQLDELAELLTQLPPRYGLAEKSWTRRAICMLIEQHFGVTISTGHVPRLLRRLTRTLPKQEVP
jgi:transposase